MMNDMLNELYLDLKEEVEVTKGDIEEYEGGNLGCLCDNFHDYAKLKGFVWGMERAMFHLRYKAEKAGIEVSE